MAMFGRNDKDPSSDGMPPERPATPQRTAQAQRTFIARGSKLEGVMRGETDVELEGELDGEVDLAATFHVLPEGSFKGNVKAEVIRIAGSIEGNVDAVQRVELLSTGRVVGDIQSPRVAIAEGGFCQGRVEMGRRPERSGSAVEASPQKELLESTPASTN